MIDGQNSLDLRLEIFKKTKNVASQETNEDLEKKWNKPRKATQYKQEGNCQEIQQNFTFYSFNIILQ